MSYAKREVEAGGEWGTLFAEDHYLVSRYEDVRTVCAHPEKAGDLIAIDFYSANRDSDRFDRPDELHLQG